MARLAGVHYTTVSKVINRGFCRLSISNNLADPRVAYAELVADALHCVADATVHLVDPLGVDAVQLAHPLGEIGIRRLNEQVIMVAHQAVGVHQPVEPMTDTAKQIKENVAVPSPEVNILSPATACSDVVESASELGPNCSCQKASLDEHRKMERPDRPGYRIVRPYRRRIINAEL